MQNSLSVSKQHPCLAGHFPGQAIVPAVVLLDLMQEQLHVFCLQEKLPPRIIIGIKKLKFTEPVKPEQILHFQWTVKSENRIHITVSHLEQTVVSGSIRTRIDA